ncbi:glycosyltransferase [Blautia wexlerae]|uniref:glycosyltransferase n=1 Tax=Blautia wexlerae TaxID=418240 RepID=UPI0032C03F67
MISVIMSVYNEKSIYVEKAIDSILNQTYSDLEIVIVLDLPDNETLLRILKEYTHKDARVKLLINDRNIGLAMSLNRAIEVAHGEYLARMDADDISKPERLERELEYLINNGLDVVSCVADKIDENGNVWGEIKPFNNRPEVIKDLLEIQNVIIHPTVLMRTDIIKSVGGYRNFPSCQDYDLWLRLITNNYKIGIINENLFQFRKHRDSVTATRRYNQILNEKYIREMYHQRLKNGKDSYSEDDLKKFLNENGYSDPHKRQLENEMLMQYGSGINLLKKRNVRGLWLVIKSLSSYSVRTSICVSISGRVVKFKHKGK